MITRPAQAPPISRTPLAEQGVRLGAGRQSALEAFFDAVGGFLGWRRQSQQSHTPACFLKLSHALGTRLKVRHQLLRFFTIKRPEGVKVEVLFELWVSVHAFKALFKNPTAARNRVLTVPRGSPVRRAISVWVSPSK